MAQKTRTASRWIWIGCLGIALCLCAGGVAIPAGIFAADENLRVQIGYQLGIIPPTATATRTPAPTATATVTSAPTSTPTGTPALTPAFTPAPTSFGGGQGRIAFISGELDWYHIYSMNTDGTGVARLAEGEWNDWEPSFSPDGTKIAYASYRNGNSDIYVMHADGSHAERLTDSAAYDGSPAWSPDGSQIAFESVRDDPVFSSCTTGCNYEIYLMNADGSNVRRLTDNPAWDWSPAWSPDGRRIAFISKRDGNMEVYSMKADGTGPVRLTRQPSVDWHPSWSPDGTRIAFVSDRDGPSSIYVMNADGSDVKRLTDSEGGDLNPAWSPDGTQIAFDSVRDSPDPAGCTSDCNYDIYIMASDGSGVRRLTSLPAVEVQPAWQP